MATAPRFPRFIARAGRPPALTIAPGFWLGVIEFGSLSVAMTGVSLKSLDRAGRSHVLRVGRDAQSVDALREELGLPMKSWT